MRRLSLLRHQQRKKYAPQMSRGISLMTIESVKDESCIREKGKPGF
jgi:hypothetical protein